MIDVRGQAIPVVDLRRLLGRPETEDTLSTRIIVLTIRAAGAEVTVALKTDRVLEVAPLDEDALEPAPEFGSTWRDGAIAGVGRRNGAFVTVLDLDSLFASADPSALAAAPPAVDHAA